MYSLLKSIEEHNEALLESLMKSRPYHIAEWKWNEINKLADEFYWKMPNDDALSSEEGEKEG